MNDSKTAVWRGQPQPLGATWDGEGVNFALFSEHADRVELCLFDPKTRRETERIAMRWQTNQVWHCYLPEARPGLLYGYRVHGPYDPKRGLRFNPNKLLLDPYAKPVYEEASSGEVYLPGRPQRAALASVGLDEGSPGGREERALHARVVSRDAPFPRVFGGGN